MMGMGGSFMDGMGKCGGSTNLFKGMTHFVVKIFVQRMLQYGTFISGSINQRNTAKARNEIK